MASKVDGDMIFPRAPLFLWSLGPASLSFKLNILFMINTLFFIQQSLNYYSYPWSYNSVKFGLKNETIDIKNCITQSIMLISRFRISIHKPLLKNAEGYFKHSAKVQRTAGMNEYITAINNIISLEDILSILACIKIIYNKFYLSSPVILLFFYFFF